MKLTGGKRARLCQKTSSAAINIRLCVCVCGRGGAEILLRKDTGLGANRPFSFFFFFTNPLYVPWVRQTHNKFKAASLQLATEREREGWWGGMQLVTF